MKHALFAFLFFLLWIGCLPPSRLGVHLRPGDFGILEQNGDSPALLRKTAEDTLTAMNALDPKAPVRLAGRTVTVADLIKTLTVFRSALDGARGGGDWVERLRGGFHLYGIPEEVLFTGYYEPLLRGSLHRTKRFRYPLYRRPPELKPDPFGINGTVSSAPPPYYTRKEIDSGHVLAGRGLEQVWLDDPVERFFLQIQGAGSIRLTDGSVIRVQYDGSNGRPYRSIGRLLIREGKLTPKEGSVQGISTWLRGHPSEAERIMNADPRYIFFKVAGKGAHGVLDIPLTPLHSLATDPRVIPAGTLLYYTTKLPVLDEKGDVSDWRYEGHFAVSQDIGKAIEGPFRADIYFGEGKKAGAMAGVMMVRGRLYILIRKR
ncbi:MAG: murein transglycosylase A [Deltaproteobacteria bacterium]|nr:murein transglycosylase A [Deltaproteobacteria bacterium]